MEKFEAFGNTVETLEDGSIQVSTPAGAVFKMNNESGGMHVTLPSISRIGIDNIIDLKSYSLTTEGDLVTHAVEFKDGGKFTMSYNADGSNFHFGGEKICQTISRDSNALSIRSFAEEARQKETGESS